jgi:anti-sigma factor RsiW
MSTHPDPEQLSAYIDGELTGGERDVLEQHLTGCSDCSATVRALRTTVADMRALPAPFPSEQESWALRAAISKARKRPAVRYGRWTVAAGSVAAVAIAVVALANIGHKPSETFGQTTPEVSPQSAAGADSAASLIEIDPTNYTKMSASLLVTRGPAVAPGAATAPLAATPSPGTTGASGGTSGVGGSGSTSMQKNAYGPNDAQRTAYISAIRRCEQQVLPNTTSTLTPLRYIVGTYEGTPAFFLLYSVPAGGETKLELWVVQRTDCYIRLFVPPR